MSRPTTSTPTDLLDHSHEPNRGPRHTDDVRPHAPGTENADVTGGRRRRRGRVAVRILAGVVLLSTVSVLFVELRHTDLRATFAHIQWLYVGLAIASIAVSVVAAAYNLMGFTPLRVRFGSTLLAQLAVSAIRVVTPSAVSTPAIATRYLTRSGATTPDALASVGVAQTVQLVVTTALVGGFGVVSGWAELQGVGRRPLSLWLGGGLLVFLSGWLAVRLSTRAARLARQAATSVMSVIAHTRAHPLSATIGIVAGAMLTVTHVAAFAFCVRAAGGNASILTLATVYLASAAAGSILPTPGGTGAVEAALIAGLTVAGVPLPIATAATLLSRLVSVWLLVLPGWVALVSLRRRGLL
jgi:uncharacterized membrane protein YbhN (UPF0104 family)